MSRAKDLNRARKTKDDEFYTQYDDIRQEMENYKKQLKGKSLYFPCDDYRKSNFYKYFKDNFKEYRLKSITATNYDETAGTLWDRKDAFKATYDGEGEKVSRLEGSGSFDSLECIEEMRKCDVVITNPPFSLAQRFMQQVYEAGKDFIVVNTTLNITSGFCKRIFNSGKIRMGYRRAHHMTFTHEDGEKKDINCYFFTSFPVDYEPPELELKEKYDPKKCPSDDNMDLIYVDNYKEIPYDYNGYMAVSINFLRHINTTQFEIKGILDSNDLTLAGKPQFKKLIIMRKERRS